MKDFEALKDIWHSQKEVSMPDYNSIKNKIQHSKNSFTKKLLSEITLSAVILVALTFIWLHIKPYLWTSHAGFLVFIACIFYYLFTQIKHYIYINQSDYLLKEPHEYIAFLKTYKKKRYRLFTKKFITYLSFTAIGFILFGIEFFMVASLWQALVFTCFIIIWYILTYYVFMKKYVYNEQKRLEEILANLNDLESQFTEQ